MAVRGGGRSSLQRVDKLRPVRQFVSACLTLCAAVLVLPIPTAAAAATTLQHVSVGFRGYYGKNSWVPVNAQVSNPGPATAAQLTINVSSDISATRNASGTLHWMFSLPANSTVNKQVLVPGFLIGNGSLNLVINGVVRNSIPLAGNALGNVALVVVLSHQAQVAQTLLGSENSTAAAPVLPVTMAPSAFPASIDGLSGLTAIVSTPHDLAELSPTQTASIQSWVRLGGMLIVTNTLGESTAWNGWYPLTTAPAHKVSGSGLELFIGGTQLPTPRLTIQAAPYSLAPGASLWAETGAQPLIAEQSEGRGTVVQTSFSPSDPALVVWPGIGTLWTTLLKMGGAQSQSALPDYLSPTGVFSLASASEGLTPLRVPSLRFWATLFGIYVLCAGPLLFFLLRRLRRQPAAWVVLPVFSVLVTVGIYLFGASQRPTGMLTEGAGILDLVGNGQAEAYGVRAMMSPRVSTFDVVVAQPMLALPLVEHNNGVSEEESTLIGRGTRVSFRRVSRWGVRYTYLAGAVKGQGELSAALANDLGTLIGTVQNNTPYTLNDIAIGWNGALYELGDLKPGATVVVPSTHSAILKTGNWLGAYSGYNHDITRSIGRSIGSLAGTEQLLYSDIGINSALLVATTRDTTPGLGSVVALEAKTSDQTLTLVRQYANVVQAGEGGVRST
ncbi:hypothetical protein [Alicyclobacillus sp. ALC3]|uniref:hypothetical protein n=1 Tax=Alicyclobacillus sp. ALC3 TaxID=2796143 RepID=UPI002379AB16|nr:hypothetical protein [Alicyclobacillus sp. ALC3]WDL96291.1 hypothetical protein JC200_18450 [Alicyclobacillus sp. ALC3]